MRRVFGAVLRETDRHFETFRANIICLWRFMNLIIRIIDLEKKLIILKETMSFSVFSV